uniref:Putative glycerophosphoryl diester phosphodiesterase n=1 Tax=Corethrella appendiculata TaxID=1370023 RepID=U5EFZ0_9DIPT
MYFTYAINTLKMFYQLFWYLMTIISFIINIFYFCSLSLPWITLILILICIISKFIKLKNPDKELIQSLLYRKSIEDEKNLLLWPIINKGGAFDYPENSVTAIKQCISQKCSNILLDLSITSDGELIILHKSTLEKANVNTAISQLQLSYFDNFNIVEHHPLGQHFKPEKILTLKKLLQLLEKNDLTIFLLMSTVNAKIIDALKEVIGKNEKFTKQIVLCCSSPIAIYQLRKLYSNLVCGLWMEKTLLSKTPKYFNSSTIFLSICGAIFRNIIAPVIGVSVVFIHKDGFNTQISSLWQNVGVKPIVYTINSPNEKRYFQQVTKTQYLTDSLRSEPQIIFKARRT